MPDETHPTTDDPQPTTDRSRPIVDRRDRSNDRIDRGTPARATTRDRERPRGARPHRDRERTGQSHGRLGLGREEFSVEVKTGTVSHDSPGAAADGTWDTYEIDRQTVTFEEPFEAPPVVFIGSTSYTTIGLFRAIDVTEEAFESRWMVYRSESFAAPDAQWVAIGQS